VENQNRKLIKYFLVLNLYVLFYLNVIILNIEELKEQIFEQAKKKKIKNVFKENLPLNETLQIYFSSIVHKDSCQVI